MRQLATAINEFEMGALSPAEPTLYTKMGWVFWQGPLLIRAPDGLLSTPDASVMILRLPKTPPLDLTVGLSAESRQGELW